MCDTSLLVRSEELVSVLEKGSPSISPVDSLAETLKRMTKMAVAALDGIYPYHAKSGSVKFESALDLKCCDSRRVLTAIVEAEADHGIFAGEY